MFDCYDYHEPLDEQGEHEIVYALEYIAHRGESAENVLGIGTFSTAGFAMEVRNRIRTLVGFRDAPDAFRIVPLKVNQIHWIRNGEMVIDLERPISSDRSQHNPESPTL